MRKYMTFCRINTFSMKNNLENIVYEKITVFTKTQVICAGTEIAGNSYYDQTSTVKHYQLKILFFLTVPSVFERRFFKYVQKIWLI